jgi:hypothetical protein
MSYDVEERLRPLIGLFIAISTILMAALALGNATLFDRLLLAILMLSLIYCRANINTLGVVLAVIFGRLLEEILWPISHLVEIQSIKVALYLLIGYGFWWLRGDYRNNVIITSIYIVCVLAEIYWLSIGYSPPNIVWFLLLILQALFVRWLLFMRFTFTEKWFPMKVRFNHLEWQMYGVYQWFIICQIFMLGEYLFRHIFNLQIHLVYELYPYISHVLSMYIVWLILGANTREIENNRVKA